VKVPELAAKVQLIAEEVRMLAAEVPGLAIPFDDLIEIVFEAVADGDDLFTDIDLVAGNGIDMIEGYDEGPVNADEFLGRQFDGE
jgi:hypothetical protein